VGWMPESVIRQATADARIDTEGAAGSRPAAPSVLGPQLSATMLSRRKVGLSHSGRSKKKP